MKISDFQIKDVINISDGRRLGLIGDIEINLETGKIDAIVITGTGRLLHFLSNEEQVVIPWKNILKIGVDVVLVRHQMGEQAQLPEGDD